MYYNESHLVFWSTQKKTSQRTIQGLFTTKLFGSEQKGC